MARLARRRKRENKVERFLPLGYFGLALAAAVMLLPSALRPPAQQPNQTAELSPHAPPECRIHHGAVRAVLEALLPEGGGDLKGASRSRHELLLASGYINRPTDFAELEFSANGDNRRIYEEALGTGFPAGERQAS